VSAGGRPARSYAPASAAAPAWVYVAVLLALVVAAMAFGYVLLDSPA
jgi:hypothetical protein